MKIRFEGLANGFQVSPIPDGYAGMNWTNIGAVDTGQYPGTGYDNVLNSGTDVGYTYDGWSRMRSATDFDLDRGWFAAAYTYDLKVVFRGYDDGVLTGKLKLHFDTDKVLVKFGDGFDSIDSLVITTEDHASQVLGEQLAFDDLDVTFESAAPADDFIA